jgi:hypothetical protein
MKYTTYRLADGVTFVHVAHFIGTENPLATLPVFVEFQRELAQRCVEPPAPSEATVVGSYGKSSYLAGSTGQVTRREPICAHTKQAHLLMRPPSRSGRC